MGNSRQGNREVADKTRREYLCREMEALTSVRLDPEDKASQIKHLQHEWRGLPGSADEDLWRRFQDAGHQAYADCARHFALKADERTQNLRRREAICLHLAAYIESIDWEAADWPVVVELIRSAREEWRDTHDIPHQKRRSIEKRFRRLIGQIESQVVAEQQRNHEKKRALIETLKLQLNKAGNRAGQRRLAMTLQSEWRAVGITERDTDQKLWQEFRQYCDQLFD